MAGRGRNSDVVTIIYPPGCREVRLYYMKVYLREQWNISNIFPPVPINRYYAY